MTTFQAIPPVNLFAVPPTATITGDAQYLVQGVVPAIYPGPLVMPLFGSQVSERRAHADPGLGHELGLLSGKTDFMGDGSLPGGITGQIELTVDGRLVALRGLPDAASPDPKPGVIRGIRRAVAADREPAADAPGRFLRPREASRQPPTRSSSASRPRRRTA